MQHLGLLSCQGLKAISEIWGSIEYSETEDPRDGRELTDKLPTRPDAEKLIPDKVDDRYLRALYNEWQIPMYNLDFSIIPVTLEELEAEQEKA